MPTITKFEDIAAWQDARLLTREVYSATNVGSFTRDFPLRDQIRRGCISILANIAEGFERDGDKEFLQFLSIAKGSSGEVRSHLYVALDQGYISEEQFDLFRGKAVGISGKISSFMSYLRQSSIRGSKYKDLRP